MTDYFADTYALVEYIHGNPAYKPYFTGRIVTSEQNLIELFYTILKKKGEATAIKEFSTYSTRKVPITFNCIREAMKFKLAHARQKLSYADCIGYALAREMKIPFLTGDQQFADKENVAFVK